MGFKGLNRYLDFDTMKYKYLREAFIMLINTENTMFVSKIAFINYVVLVSGVLLVTIAALAINVSSAGQSSVFMLTAVLAVDSSVMILFLALSGFNSQRLSISRIKEAANTAHYYTYPKINVYNNTYQLPAVRLTNNRSYLQTELPRGEVLSLRGRSGVGKTQYLLALSGLSDVQLSMSRHNEDAQIIYIDNQFFDIMEWIKNKKEGKSHDHQSILLSFIDKKISERFRIFILDELTAKFSEKDAQSIVFAISQMIKKCNGLLLVVDHRFSLSSAINIEDLMVSPLVPA